jgi:hypothetical protein
MTFSGENRSDPEQRFADGDPLAPVIAVQGLRQAYGEASGAARKIRTAIESMSQEVTAPQGKLFAVHYAPSTRPVMNGHREVVQGTYVAAEGMNPPVLTESTPILVSPRDAPFLAVTIAATATYLLAVGRDGMAREFSHDRQDWVELVPDQAITHQAGQAD